MIAHPWLQVWVRELAAALLVAGDKASSKGQRGVEELVLAGVGIPTPLELYSLLSIHIERHRMQRISSA